MNKYIIGAVFSICGTLLLSAILISGAIFSATASSWSGSVYWSAILGKSTSDEGMSSMGLSFLFYFSIALFLVGISCLLWEQIKIMLEKNI